MLVSRPGYPGTIATPSPSVHEAYDRNRKWPISEHKMQTNYNDLLCSSRSVYLPGRLRWL